MRRILKGISSFLRNKILNQPLNKKTTLFLLFFFLIFVSFLEKLFNKLFILIFAFFIQTQRRYISFSVCFSIVFCLLLWLECRCRKFWINVILFLLPTFQVLRCFLSFLIKGFLWHVHTLFQFWLWSWFYHDRYKYQC